MTKYLIIEDEPLAYDELHRMMSLLRPNYELAGWAQTVEQATKLLQQSTTDLVLADVQLADGLVWKAFETAPTESAIIFTTAYDEYALRAFKLNSIDYLLKPIIETELATALQKWERGLCLHPHTMRYEHLADSFTPSGQKERFLIRMGDTFRHIGTAEIAYFLSEDKLTNIYTTKGRCYVVDYSLDELERLIPSRHFFRASRSCIVSIGAVDKAVRHFGGRVKLTLTPPIDHEIMVSRSRVADLLKWMDGNPT